MKRLIHAELYKLTRTRNLYYLITFILLECIAISSIPRSGQAMLIKRINIDLSQDMELSFFAGIFLVTDFSKRLWGPELTCGHSVRRILLSKMLVFAATSMILYALSLFVPVLLTSMLYERSFTIGVFPYILSGFMKILFMISALLLLSFTFRRQLITFSVGSALCFVVTKLSEYMLEPTIPIMAVSAFFLVLFFLLIMILHRVVASVV